MSTSGEQIKIEDIGREYEISARTRKIDVSAKTVKPAATCRIARPSELLKAQNNELPAYQLAAFAAVLQYRVGHPWLPEPATLQDANSSVVIENYGDRYLIVTLDQSERATDVNGSVIFGCGRLEYYRVTLGSMKVMPFWGCVEPHGATRLLGFDKLPP